MSSLSAGFGTYTDKPIMGTRYIGGHNRYISPLINGYFQFYVNLPVAVFGGTAGTAVDSSWLTCSCESWTPPTRTVTSGEVPGQGGLGASFITGQTLNRTFTTTHRDYNNIPINKLFRIWSNVINTYTGISPLGGDDWSSAAYKSDGYIIKTKPSASGGISIVANDIEDIWYFTGLWPEGDGEDGLGDDINSPDIAGTYSITWHFDGYPYRGKNLYTTTLSTLFTEAYKKTPAS